MATNLLKTLSPDLLKPIGSVNKLTFIFPAMAKATTSGGEARKLALTSWWTRPSKFLFPDKTEQTVKSFVCNFF